MAGTPIDLSAFKPVAGQPLAAAPISNALTAIETWSGASIDPASMLQKAATTDQAMGWTGTLWAPRGYVGTAPTIIPSPNPPNSTSVGPFVANEIYLFPFPLVVPTTITRIVIRVATQSGNIDVGVYSSDDDSTLTRIVSKGSTACPAAGSSALTISTTTLTPVTGRRWYFAMSANNATAVFAGSSVQFGVGSFTKSGAGFPLPATLTTPTAGAIFAPLIYALI